MTPRKPQRYFWIDTRRWEWGVKEIALSSLLMALIVSIQVHVSAEDPNLLFTVGVFFGAALILFAVLSFGAWMFNRTLAVFRGPLEEPEQAKSD